MSEIDSGKVSILRIRIENDIKAAAKRAAQSKGRTLSQHVRELLRDDIGAERLQSDKQSEQLQATAAR